MITNKYTKIASPIIYFNDNEKWFLELFKEGISVKRTFSDAKGEEEITEFYIPKEMLLILITEHKAAFPPMRYSF